MDSKLGKPRRVRPLGSDWLVIETRLGRLEPQSPDTLPNTYQHVSIHIRLSQQWHV